MGNVYLTGATKSTDFPTVNAAQPGFSGGGVDCPSDLPTRLCYGAFVTKINAAGTEILYSTYLGNPRDDEGRAIAVDPAGQAYVTGEVSSGVPTTQDAIQPEKGEVIDGFVAVVNTAGDGLLYSTSLGAAAPTVMYARVPVVALRWTPLGTSRSAREAPRVIAGGQPPGIGSRMTPICPPRRDNKRMAHVTS